jgi:hypothetical protein
VTLEFDARTSSLVADPPTLDALIGAAAGRAPGDAGEERRRAELAAAGALAAGAPHPALAPGLQALLAPVVELRLQQGSVEGEGWADGEGSALVLPRDGDRRLHVVPTSFLPAALARVNELGPRPRAEAAERHRVGAGELARVLAAGSGAIPPTVGLRRHWRVEARWPAAEGSPGVRHVEVLDTEGGLWLVVPDDPEVELWPSTPTMVWRLLSALLPRDDELDFDRL